MPSRVFLCPVLFLLAASFCVACKPGHADSPDSRRVELVASVPPVAGERRLALVIGDAAYTGTDVHTLVNPIHDADAMATTLQTLGFSVTELRNANRVEIRNAVDDFTQSISAAGNNVVALLYFSGHGMQIEGSNYLIPIGFQSPPVIGGVPRHVEEYAYPVQSALDEMTAEQARVKIVILDACRTNPYVIDPAKRGGGERGLAAITNPPIGVFVAYAAGANQSAADNSEGANGVYTQDLLKSLRTPGLNIDEVFKQTQVAVNEDTHGGQVPCNYDGMVGDDFYFAGKPQLPGRTELQAPDDTASIEADFQKCLETRKHSSSRDFIKVYAPAHYGDWLKWADKGNADAQFLVGVCNDFGVFVPQDYALAFKWSLQSAEQGNSAAMNELGVIYESGTGVPRDHAVAMDWYTKAANAGDGRAMCNLGVLYADPDAVEHDYSEAMAWYVKAAAAGVPAAMRDVGDLYANGNGVEKNPAEAMTWYRKAADAGDASSKGVLLANKIGPAFRSYVAPSATAASKSAALDTVRSALSDFKASDLAGADAVLTDEDVRNATEILNKGSAADPMLAARNQMVDQYVRLYELADLDTKQSYAGSFAGYTADIEQKQYKAGSYDDVSAFWKKSFSGLPIKTLTDGDKSDLIRELDYCVSSLLLAGNRAEGQQLLSDSLTLCDGILADRPWDWYAKEGCRDLCFDSAATLSDLGEGDSVQPLLKRAWTAELKMFGKSQLLERYKTLPLKGQVPDGAFAEDMAFFKSYAPDAKSVEGSQMKRFTIPCDFSGTKYPFYVYVVQGPAGYEELQDQLRWLKEYRGGVVPQDVRDAFRKLNKIAVDNKVDFCDLCVYALGTVDKDDKKGTGKSGTDTK